MMLESLVHAHSSFVTLTYDDASLPEAGSLEPRDLQLWLKRFRQAYAIPVRYFACGEYGDISWRPHYHLALFGHNREEVDVVRETWGRGHVVVGDLTLHSAQYIAGYVTKKMTGKDDVRLNGLYPEFARMSLKPGIGALAIPDVAAALQNKNGWDEISRLSDVPSALRHGQRVMPLGRYMRIRLRAAMNFADLKESDDAAWKRSAEMLVVYQNYVLEQGSPKGFFEYIATRDTQRVHQMEKKMKIHERKPL